MQPGEKNNLKRELLASVIIVSIVLSAVVGFFAGRIGSRPSSLVIGPPGTQDSFRAASVEEELIVSAVESATPAVVSVIISRNVPIIERCFISPFGDNPLFRQFFGNIQVPSECERGTELREVGGGSGFIVREDGLIITNKHVVDDEGAEYTVITFGGERYSAEVLARDPLHDLAILKINASGMPTIPFGNSDAIKIGQSAIAIGYALGEFENSVSVGVVSGLSRSVSAASSRGATEELRNIIQTDAAINFGNSGGPLLNLRGELIGINTAVASGAENIGFAIPSLVARRAIESIERDGKIIYPFLGVRYVNLTPAIAEENNLPVTQGAWLSPSNQTSPIVPESPASRGGLESGDIILALGGEKVSSTRTLGDLLEARRVGETVTLTVRRGERVLELAVTLAEREFE